MTGDERFPRVSRCSATCSGPSYILSGVLQLLRDEEELLRPQRDSLTETSVITPAVVFRASRVLGAQDFPGLSCLVSNDMLIQPPASDRALRGPRQNEKPGRKSIISQCTCSEIKLDHLQDPISSAWVFHGPRQEI